jgi:hypothetical protein
VDCERAATSLRMVVASAMLLEGRELAKQTKGNS